MLTAYYSCGCNSKELFSEFEIVKNSEFERYLNRYNTISVNMLEFLSRSKDIYELIHRFKALIIRELKAEFPQIDYFDDTDLA